MIILVWLRCSDLYEELYELSHQYGGYFGACIGGQLHVRPG